MKSLIELLSSPHIAAHFQRLCGVQWADPDELDPVFPRKKVQENEHFIITDDDVIVKNKFLYCTFYFGSAMAARPFYYAFIPTCSWILDVGIARKTMMQLALVMYIGQSVKDILRRRRPPSPPVIRLEKMYETEYGMPSTHTMAGTVTPFSLLMFSSQIYEIPVKPSFAAATAWTSLVSMSRVYMGVHSIWQVLVGATAAGSLAYFFVDVVDSFDENLVKSSILTSFVVAGGAVLSYVIFQLDSGLDPETNLPRWNTARGDTTEMLGVCSGFLAGTNWSIAHGLHVYRTAGHRLIAVPEIDIQKFTLIFLAGGLMFIGFSEIFKSISFHILAKIRGVPTSDLQEAKRNPKLELPLKYSSGLFAGFIGTTLIPWVLNEMLLW